MEDGSGNQTMKRFAACKCIEEEKPPPSKLTPEQLAREEALIARSCLLQTLDGPFLSAASQRMWVYRLGGC